MDDKAEMDKLASMVLELTPSLRGVGFVDHSDNTLFSKMSPNKTSLISNEEEEKFATDLLQIKKLRDTFNDALGKVLFSHITREKIQQLFYHHDSVTIYVSCDPDVDHNTIVEISKLIKDTLEEYRSIKLSVKT